ncbi:hypothetical protein IE077_004291 [Cardiosporidium cionae]|uniref:Uncharacterized protein n=1 Tax=Cardiosporidium cionae TaxID=476202 RepID=A0ABQ7JG27_9APIC|nr:hypothetical protein IE077_004291 [Cardiosporidium cionae]|eukprot:KAF8822967.1 hypothetical protein IE077_004291 [Cardiosporidium cionae]
MRKGRQSKMTRGNQREVDRLRAAKRASKTGAASTVKDREKNLSVICGICKQSFMCTVNRVTLNQHVESKHPKFGFEECFPHQDR